MIATLNGQTGELHTAPASEMVHSLRMRPSIERAGEYVWLAEERVHVLVLDSSAGRPGFEDAIFFTN